MTRHPSLASLLFASSLLTAACAASEQPRTSASQSECSGDLGASCECDDGSASETICNDGDLVCDCDQPGDDDGDDFVPSGRTDASVRPRDAGSDAGRRGGSDSGAKTDAGGGSGPLDAGARSDAGPGADAGSQPPPDAGEPPMTGSGDLPKIPEPSGACPEFRTGTATIGGLSGIAVQAGAKKNGTGAILFYWHGTGSSSGEVRLFPAAAQREILDEGGIIISPQRSLGTGGDCSGTGTFSKDDMKVADLIVACAVKNHGINPRRIYTTGCSAGGLQAGCFASLRSSYVAAAVPNSGGVVFPQTIQDPKHIPALMTMHGSAADTVIVTFSQTSATLGNQFAKAGGYVLNCNHGGGHCAAPAALQSAGWRFMKDHPFGVSPKPYAGGLPSGYPTYCKPVGQ
jgi:hypothetical protein